VPRLRVVTRSASRSVLRWALTVGLATAKTSVKSQAQVSGVPGEFLHDPEAHGVSERSQCGDRLVVDWVAHVSRFAFYRGFPI